MALDSWPTLALALFLNVAVIRIFITPPTVLLAPKSVCEMQVRACVHALAHGLFFPSFIAAAPELPKFYVWITPNPVSG